MKRILTVLTLSAVLASPAWSGFINNKSDWDSLGSQSKAIYAIGAHDSVTEHDAGDSNLTTKLRRHRVSCVINNGLNGFKLAELIDSVYRSDVSTWSVPPNVVMNFGLAKMCGSP